ncbi:MAG: hypothetical protein KAJ73_00265 [Zetaproteobacteria bacterium]|nr:hypothetical protein [Zetaproteobacteria bacterium]
MPVPKPTSGESEDEFIARCKANETMQGEYPDQEQRSAVCYDSWRQRSDYDVEDSAEVAPALIEEAPAFRLFMKDDEGYERVVFAEIIIPDAMNVYGDLHTRESVKQFAYSFMINGFGIDIGHDNLDVSDTLAVVESFIARDGDPDFVPGAWVIGMYVGDDAAWAKVLNGDLNGFSYEAWVKAFEVVVDVPVDIVRSGVTEPAIEDGHVHEYVAILDDDGRVIYGGTSESNGHYHEIRSHTTTEEEDDHLHIFNFVQGSGGL